MYFSAYFRQARRNSTTGAAAAPSPWLLASSRSTCSSMGRPWQSHPGTYGASNPAMVRERTMTSFKILLSAVPTWISPFAYGGPSCRT